MRTNCQASMWRTIAGMLCMVGITSCANDAQLAGEDQWGVFGATLTGIETYKRDRSLTNLGANLELVSEHAHLRLLRADPSESQADCTMQKLIPKIEGVRITAEGIEAGRWEGEGFRLGFEEAVQRLYDFARECHDEPDER